MAFRRRVPDPRLLAVLVALLDVAPVVRSVTAGVIATLAVLSPSVPVALATAGFFVAYRLLEDYLLQPKIIGRTVHVPTVTTVGRCCSAARGWASSARWSRSRSPA